VVEPMNGINFWIPAAGIFNTWHGCFFIVGYGDD